MLLVLWSPLLVCDVPPFRSDPWKLANLNSQPLTPIVWLLGSMNIIVGMALYLLYCWRETNAECTTVGERIHMFSKCHLLRCSICFYCVHSSGARLGWASTHTVLLRLYAVNESVQLSCETCLYSAILDDDAIGKSTEDLMKPEQVLLWHSFVDGDITN